MKNTETCALSKEIKELLAQILKNQILIMKYMRVPNEYEKNKMINEEIMNTRKLTGISRYDDSINDMDSFSFAYKGPQHTSVNKNSNSISARYLREEDSLDTSYKKEDILNPWCTTFLGEMHAIPFKKYMHVDKSVHVSLITENVSIDESVLENTIQELLVLSEEAIKRTATWVKTTLNHPIYMV